MIDCNDVYSARIPRSNSSKFGPFRTDQKFLTPFTVLTCDKKIKN